MQQTMEFSAQKETQCSLSEFCKIIIINHDFSKPEFELFNKELLQELEVGMSAFYPMKYVRQFRRQMEAQHGFSLLRNRAYRLYRRIRLLQIRLKYSKVLEALYWKRKIRIAEREFLIPNKF